MEGVFGSTLRKIRARPSILRYHQWSTGPLHQTMQRMNQPGNLKRMKQDMNAVPASSVQVLLVEDNLGDAVLTREALQDGKLSVNLHHVMDGQQALDYLRKEKKYRDAVTPDIILLDLNMPGVDGREFLKIVKKEPEFAMIPVVVLTTSKADEDVLSSYSLQAACFVTKPVDFSQFQTIVEKLSDFWFTVVKLPKADQS